MKRIIPLLAIIIALSAASCAKIAKVINEKSQPCTATGPEVTQSRPADKITEISTCVGLKVVYIQSPETSLSVTAPSDIIDLVRTNVTGGLLTVDSERSLGECAGLVTITVHSPAINLLSASSGGCIEASNLSLPGKKLTVTASSGAAIRLSGKCDDVTLTASSGAAISASGLTAKTGTAIASSGAAINSHILSPETISNSSGAVVNNKN